MSKRKNLLYIGNKGVSQNANITYMETLSRLLEVEGYSVTTASSKKNKVLRMLDMLWTVFKYRSSDLLLIDTYSTQNFYYAVAVANVARLFRIPYVPILHGGNLPSRLQRSKSQSRKLFGGAPINVSPSQYLYDAFKKEGYTNLKLIPNSLPIDAYPFFLRKRALPKLLWVRSFSKLYNPTLAISVVKELLKRDVEVELCMIGPEADGLLEECKRLANKDSFPITFTGKLTKEEWHRRSTEFSIFINTTNFDNTPVSVIEAMALGLPIISTNVGGLPYLIDHEVNGLLVAPNDAVSFANAIERIVNQPELATQLSLAGRKKAETFDWNVVKQEWIGLLG